MKPKKIVFIILLILFISGIAFAVIKLNEKSNKKQEGAVNNTIKNTSTNVAAKKQGTPRGLTGSTEATSKKVVEITDNFFIEQTTDVYINLEDYLGKTIKIEGLIYTYQDNNGDICYAVVRNTPGCCGTDGLAGIDIRYDGEYPKENTWVKIEGVMGKDVALGETVPAIQVVSIEEAEKGQTFVTN